MFGFSEPEIAGFGLRIGLGGLMLYMLFIVLRLAKESGAGRTGTLVLFFVLSFGMFGFVAKSLIQWWLER